ncbi:M48 family metallopeptidase [bacterium]|nr:M48 family metallopeptidase [candidate division CSSED10-310 bacterium]
MKHAKKHRVTRKLVQSGSADSAIGSFDYMIYTDRRARVVKLKWYYGKGLTMTVPWKARFPSIETIVLKKSEWLKHCFEEESRLMNQSTLSNLGVSKKVPYMGQVLPVRIYGPPKKAAEINLHEDELHLVGSQDVDEVIETHLIKWLIRQSRLVLCPIVDRIALAMNVPVRLITIRNQRTRWASWSSSKTISLNWRLITAPPSVIEYVVIHELTHHRHPNHSKEFWKAVSGTCPDWQNGRSWLINNSHLLHYYRPVNHRG